MKKSLICIFLISVLLYANVSATILEGVEFNQETGTVCIRGGILEIHVATDGSDQNPGTQSEPFLSITKAKEQIRSLKQQGLSAPINVIIHGGVYEITEPISFTQQDSGTEDAEITYKAAEGERVVFTGAKSLDTSFFKRVTQQTVLNRIPNSARDYVLEMDLTSQGITQSQLELSESIPWLSIFPLEFYFNGKKQPVSEWPNGRYENFNGVDNTKFNISAENAVRWSDLKGSYVCGYISNSYAKTWLDINSVSTVDNQMDLKTNGYFSGGLDEKGKYKIMHALEEIDLPGEWYVDKEKGKLYFYPPKNIEAGDSFEMAVYRNSFIEMNQTKHVKFEGLEFKNSYYPATSTGNIETFAIKANDVENIVIDGCSVNNCAGNGIFVNGTNNQIINCDVYNMGSKGIVVKGGNQESLMSSGNVISNNYTYSLNEYFNPHGGGNSINGVEMMVKNNVFHRSFGTILSYSGQKNQFLNNEIYNGTIENKDSGLIYSGRSYIRYGNTFMYNYLHDMQWADDNYTSVNNLLYWDDTLSGQTAKYNIFYVGNNVNRSILASGRDNVFENNTIFTGGSDGVKFSDWSTWWWQYNPQGSLPSFVQTALNELYTIPYNTPPWSEQFPMIASIPQELETGETDEKGEKIYNLFYPRNNRVVGNVFINTGVNFASTIPEYGQVEDNFQATIDESLDNVFENIERQDFRLKQQYKSENTIAAGVLDSTFNMEEIGLKRNQPQGIKEFNLIYPKDGMQLSEKNICLSWDRADFADEYRYIIAIDSGLSNIIYEGTTFYNSVEISDISPISKYYWTVYAVNKSRQFQEEWQALQGVKSFYVDNHSVHVKKAALYGDDDKYLTQAPNGSFNVKLNAYSKASGALNSNVIIGVYEGDAILKSAFLDTIELSDTEKVYTIKCQFANINTGDYIKVFIWEDGNLKPLASDMVLWQEQ